MTRCDSFLPTAVHTAPAAAQSVVTGSASSMSASETGCTLISQRRFEGGASRRARITNPPVTQIAVSRSVLWLISISSLKRSSNTNAASPSCVAGIPTNCAVNGSASPPVIVTVAEPIPVPSCRADTAISSSPSVSASKSAVSVALAALAPGSSVRDPCETVKSASRVAVLPEKSSVIACSSRNTTPFVISSRKAALSPSATSAGSAVSANSAASFSVSTTVAEAASADTV